MPYKEAHRGRHTEQRSPKEGITKRTLSLEEANDSDGLSEITVPDCGNVFADTTDANEVGKNSGEGEAGGADIVASISTPVIQCRRK